VQFDFAETIARSWHLGRREKMAKLMTFLTGAKQHSDVLYSHELYGSFYILKLDVKNKSIYLCPTAFKMLIHAGNDTLRRAISPTSPTVQPKQQIRTKSDDAHIFLLVFVVAHCVPDDKYPSFIRYGSL
jgi:hypothetical protein